MKLLSTVLLSSLLTFSSLNATEEVPTTAEVAKLYIATFKRAASSEGLNYWTDSSFDGKPTLSKIASSFFDQPETKELYPPDNSNEDFIKSIYHNLFNREPKADGLNYWVEALDTSRITRDKMILAIINGALDNDTAQDATVLNNQKVVGLHFAAQGLTDKEQAKSIMNGITAEISTVLSAKSTINAMSDKLPQNPTGTLVDPYIEGAVLCEDINNNGSCDEGEQSSSSTTADGEFSFEEPLTPDSNVIIKVQGKHLEKTYDLELSGVVDANGKVEVVSPMTTMESKELLPTQLAEILNYAAVTAGLSDWDITATDVSSDPISGSLMAKQTSEITDADLVKIQASIATYALLRIVKGSTILSELSANELYASAMGLDGEGAIGSILSPMLKAVSDSLNRNLLEDIKSTVAQAREMAQTTANSAASSIMEESVRTQILSATANSGMSSEEVEAMIAAQIAQQSSQAIDLGSDFLPEPTVEDIINVAVVIIERVSEIGYTKCNSSGGDYNAALADALAVIPTLSSHENVMKIGIRLYGMKHEQSFNQYKEYIPYADIVTGMNDAQNGKVTYRFNSDNVLVAQ